MRGVRLPPLSPKSNSDSKTGIAPLLPENQLELTPTDSDYVASLHEGTVIENQHVHDEPSRVKSPPIPMVPLKENNIVRPLSALKPDIKVTENPEYPDAEKQNKPDETSTEKQRKHKNSKTATKNNHQKHADEIDTERQKDLYKAVTKYKRHSEKNSNSDGTDNVKPRVEVWNSSGSVYDSDELEAPVDKKTKKKEINERAIDVGEEGEIKKEEEKNEETGGKEEDIKNREELSTPMSFLRRSSQQLKEKKFKFAVTKVLLDRM